MHKIAVASLTTFQPDLIFESDPGIGDFVTFRLDVTRVRWMRLHERGSLVVQFTNLYKKIPFFTKGRSTRSECWGLRWCSCQCKRLSPLRLRVRVSHSPLMSTLCRKSWVFSGCSGFLPQGKLTGWVRITGHTLITAVLTAEVSVLYKYSHNMFNTFKALPSLQERPDLSPERRVYVAKPAH